MELTDSIEVVNGVGPAVAKHLRQLGIRTVFDLVDYLPRRYEDYSEVTDIYNLHPGPVTIKAEVKQATGRYVRRGMHITEAVCSDATGCVRAVWFNQPYRAAALKQGQEYYLSGQYELSRQRFQLMNPSAELVKDFPLNTARIIPVYRQSKMISSTQIRKLIGACVPTLRSLPETLPNWMLESHDLLPRNTAVEAMHFPASAEQLAEARRRLGFEEVLELSLASMLNKQESMAESSIRIPFKPELAREFVAHLPFKLTDDQRKAVWHIYQDMERSHPMNRLVEGDVGSGKTVVAAMAALMAIKEGYQVAFMAPTEILATQHAETLQKLMQPFQVSPVLLVGSMTASQKKRAHGLLESGEAMFVVGTHALIQDTVDMHNLGLVIIDEQHRFGVEQRKELMAKAGHMPHVLSLTATPIPRSLALTLYGELDISALKEKPSGRKPVITETVSPTKRDTAYAHVREALDVGHQVFVVCPHIKPTDGATKKAVETVYKELQKNQLKGYRIGLLHGRLKADEKAELMNRFITHELDVLVTTTVIEVGVDVPNANVMVVESAESFGLAQLHQLRGRVGRGSAEARCYLMLDDDKQPSRRLRAIASSNDGFKLAELDLEIRGPGAIYGALQHGALDLRVVKLTDTELIADARGAAARFIEQDEDLVQYPVLEARVTRLRAVTNLN